MRTAQAASPLSAQQVGVSLMAFVVVYFAVFGTGVYYLLKLMRTGPAVSDDSPDDETRGALQPGLAAST
jgi:cytochrome d ubiquinol oxidase subunit I